MNDYEIQQLNYKVESLTKDNTKYKNLISNILKVVDSEISEHIQYKDFISVSFIYQGIEHTGFPFLYSPNSNVIYIKTKYGDIIQSIDSFEKGIENGDIYNIIHIKDLWDCKFIKQCEE